MTYRRTAKYTAERQRAMQAGRAASRSAREIEYPAPIPDLRDAIDRMVDVAREREQK